MSLPMATHPKSPHLCDPRAVDLARMRRNFLAEQDSGVLYEALAAIARDPQQKNAYLELAASERGHVRFWAERLQAAGEAPPPHRLAPRTRVLILLAGVAGLVGGALSMALGEWLSVTNARELAQSLMDREDRALHRSRRIACQDPAVGEAGSAARFSFGLFALGALVPLLPFALLNAAAAVTYGVGWLFEAIAS